MQFLLESSIMRPLSSALFLELLRLNGFWPSSWASRHFPGELLMLKISKADYDLIRWEAARSYPNEGCGIILGNMVDDHRLVSLTLTCENARSDSPANRYSIKPEQVVAAFKLARNRAESIIGFYHSHPDHSPFYSTTDLVEAHWFDCSYVITSVEKGHVRATNSYVLVGAQDNKRFLPEEIEIMAYEQPLRIAL